MEASPNDSIPCFNLALAKKRMGDMAGAREIVQQSLARARSGPALVLLAQIEEAGEGMVERNVLLAEACKVMGAISSLSDWELGWLDQAARMTGDAAIENKVKQERQTRRLSVRGVGAHAGNLPDLAP